MVAALYPDLMQRTSANSPEPAHAAASVAVLNRRHDPQDRAPPRQGLNREMGCRLPPVCLPRASVGSSVRTRNSARPSLRSLARCSVFSHLRLACGAGGSRFIHQCQRKVKWSVVSQPSVRKEGPLVAWPAPQRGGLMSSSHTNSSHPSPNLST